MIGVSRDERLAAQQRITRGEAKAFDVHHVDDAYFALLQYWAQLEWRKGGSQVRGNHTA